ncbi:MAG: CPCC family cysteine-rich protein [Burkholderiaceae bacterium]
MFTCPCCGRLALPEPLGSDGICPVCHWHDDIDGLVFALDAVGPNKLALNNAQHEFEQLQRVPGSDETIRAMQFPLDPMWRRIVKGGDVFLRSALDYSGEEYEACVSNPIYWTGAVNG